MPIDGYDYASLRDDDDDGLIDSDDAGSQKPSSKLDHPALVTPCLGFAISLAAIVWGLLSIQFANRQQDLVNSIAKGDTHYPYVLEQRISFWRFGNAINVSTPLAPMWVHVQGVVAVVAGVFIMGLII